MVLIPNPAQGEMSGVWAFTVRDRPQPSRNHVALRRVAVLDIAYPVGQYG